MKNGGFGGHYGTADCTPKSSYVDFAKMSPNFGYNFDRNRMLKMATKKAQEEPEEQSKPRRKFWNFHA